jgi:NADPH2:quinone reductase
MAVQLARQLAELTVIATASRPETRAWVEELGTQHVIDHSYPLKPQPDALALGSQLRAFEQAHSAPLACDADLIAPEGRFGVIDNPATPVVVPFKQKIGIDSFLKIRMAFRLVIAVFLVIVGEHR